MIDDDVTEELRSQLRDAVEESAARDTNWTAFHSRLSAAVAPAMSELRRRFSSASNGYRVATAAGAAWWDYAAGAALAAVPIGFAAALLLVSYLRSDSAATDAPPVVARLAIASANAPSARAAFESVLTGVEAPRAAMAMLIPVPTAAFLAESAGRVAK